METPQTIAKVEFKQVLDLWVPGVPKACPRPRAVRFGNHARVHPGAADKDWRATVKLAVQPYLPPAPLEGPVRCDIQWYLPRPKRLMRKKDPAGAIPHDGARPDRDNLDKAVLDALSEAGLWRNDGQVFAGFIAKFYVAKDGRPGAEIVVWARSKERDPPAVPAEAQSTPDQEQQLQGESR